MTTTPGFTGATLDRAEHLRTDEQKLAAARADPHARLLVLDGLQPLIDAAGRLGWVPLAEAATDNELVLLGLDEGVPCFAELRFDQAGAIDRSLGVMQRLARLPAAEAALYGGARSVVDWHYRHRYCANCGTPTVPFRAGWGRRCPHCRTEHFPRVDPVVIMLAEYGGKVLLGRQPIFPRGSIRRWPASSSPASRSRRRCAASCSRRPAYMPTLCAMWSASRGRSPRR